MARTDGGGTVDAAMADDGGRWNGAGGLKTQKIWIAELPVLGRVLNLLKSSS